MFVLCRRVLFKTILCFCLVTHLFYHHDHMCPCFLLFLACSHKILPTVLNITKKVYVLGINSELNTSKKLCLGSKLILNRGNVLYMNTCMHISSGRHEKCKKSIEKGTYIGSNFFFLLTLFLILNNIYTCL
jgi:hypothetical protein